MSTPSLPRLVSRSLRPHIRPSTSHPTKTSSHLSNPKFIRRSYATALPITAAGPPPPPPQPSPSLPSQAQSKLDAVRRKSSLLEAGKAARAAENNTKASTLRKRFWRDVHVKLTPDGSGYNVLLDSRPLRTPGKELLYIPRSKVHLAHAIALEWDLLQSAAQALKTHFIPLTSILTRAQDIVKQEGEGVEEGKGIRDEIIKVMMRYLETDTLLCWAEPANKTLESTLGIDKRDSYVNGSGVGEDGAPGPSLRDLQEKESNRILAYLRSTIWPGVEIISDVLGDGGILPRSQSDVTKSVIRGWIAGLPAYELAALERAMLASKSLLIGARLIVEWSEAFRDVNGKGFEEGRERFGIEEAALASTIEVRWQTGMWGEVEDTHDVEKEDVRRQLGSAVLVVAGVSP